MKFQFNVKLNDQDYLDYNIFWNFRSHYGKKQITTFRVAITVLYIILILISLFGGNFSKDAFIGIIPMVIAFLLIQIFLKKFFSWCFKAHIKSLKKSGKAGYSPESVIEFHEESFIETTPENKTEQKYLAVERVSIVDNKMVGIHINTLMAYILPMSCFESKEQYDNFLEFIKTKCSNIDIY